MAQFNIDVDSSIIRISQLMYGICPGMSQATLFPRVFVVYALIREGLVHLKRVRIAHEVRKTRNVREKGASPHLLFTTHLLPRLDSLTPLFHIC